MDKKFRIGIIGLGWWGQQLFDFFGSLKRVEMVAVCDIKGVPDGFDKRSAKIYTNMKRFFEETDLDGVIIATPPFYHYEAAKMAAEHGVHIFCEKPMANSVEECEKMIEVCEKYDVKLFLAFKHRYARACKHIKDNIKKYGKPLFAMYTTPLFPVNDPGWKFKQGECSGIILENAVHYIDNLRYLLGDMKHIYAEGGTMMFDTDIPDTAIFNIRFKNGAIGAIGCGATSDIAITNEYLDIHFENAVCQMWGRLDSPFNLKVCWRNDHFIEEHRYEGSDGVKEEIQHFLDCIEKKEEKPLATGMDGKEAVKIALKVIQSINTEKRIEV